jgi:signal transduction histidine kinase
VELLIAFARQLAVALQNAQLYERTQQFSKELEEKISIATADLARANERMKIANEKLQDLNKAKSDFIAIVSHELRSPLTSMLGFTDLLLQGETGALGPTQKEFVDIINQNTKRLIDLINNLLNLSKIEAGRVELKKEPLDLEKTVHGVIHNFRSLLADKRLVIKVVPPAEPLPKIAADENQLARVLTNLLANAVKYTVPEGEIVVHITDGSETVQVDILDSGDGIESRDLTHMFERFYRAPRAKSENIVGTGLGLAIAKSIIEIHGGRIWAESPLTNADKELFSWEKRTNRGAKFSFTLPKKG